MEIRARYLTIGLFTLAVIAAGFFFVYWLYNSGGLGQRESYNVIFKGNVSGLFTGSPVTFNGVRVGEVRHVDIYAADPSQVLVGIGVASGTPVRADTKVGLEFQGLTGAAAVALAGGAPNAPELQPSRPGSLPFLTADEASSQSMMQAARNALQRFDGMILDNAEPLKSTIGNLESFTSALSRNSDRVDGILSGLERMTGGGGPKKSGFVADLSLPKDLPKFDKLPQGQIAISEPTAVGVLDGDKLVLDPAAGPDAPVSQWADVLPKLVQARLAQSFENAGLEGNIVRGDNAEADYQLATDIRSFAIVAGDATMADLELGVKLLNGKGRVLAGRTFHSTVPVTGKDSKAAAASLDEVFGKTMTQLVDWTISVISALPPAKSEEL